MDTATPKIRLIACQDCDLIHREIDLEYGQKLRCSRCGSTMRSSVRNCLQKTLALSIAGLILFFPAMFSPIMTISVIGLEGKSSVLDSVLAMAKTGYPFVGAMVFAMVALFPLTKLLLLFLISTALFLGRRSHRLITLFRTYRHLSEWGMVEIYMLGILVSIIKMHSMGALAFNFGFFSFFALSLITVALSPITDSQWFWQYFEPHSSEFPQPQQSPITAREMGLIHCLECGLLVENAATPDNMLARCPRCRARLSTRKINSVSKVWALLICAAILFFPANLFPIMRVDFFGIPQTTTIMDGIVYFFQSNEYFIGSIIFLASILVPLFKIVGMVIILLGLHFNWTGFLQHKAQMLNFIEFIGRWSFLDIFVITLLVAMVEFGTVTSIVAYPGARFFTIVVILTMFAAIAFDPRILWDGNMDKEKIIGENNG